jgi:hypothetical protein
MESVCLFAYLLLIWFCLGSICIGIYGVIKSLDGE